MSLLILASVSNAASLLTRSSRLRSLNVSSMGVVPSSVGHHVLLLFFAFTSRGGRNSSIGTSYVKLRLSDRRCSGVTSGSFRKFWNKVHKPNFLESEQNLGSCGEVMSNLGNVISIVSWGSLDSLDLAGRGGTGMLGKDIAQLPNMVGGLGIISIKRGPI